MTCKRGASVGKTIRERNENNKAQAWKTDNRGNRTIATFQVQQMGTRFSYNPMWTFKVGFRVEVLGPRLELQVEDLNSWLRLHG